jgi:hypothetical protein
MRFRPSIRSMNTARADGRHGTLAEREGSASPTFAWPYDTLATRHPLPSATRHDRQGREWLPVKGSERLRSRQHPWPDPATLQTHAATQSNYRLRSPRAAGRQTKALVAQPPHKVGFCRAWWLAANTKRGDMQRKTGCTRSIAKPAKKTQNTRGMQSKASGNMFHIRLLRASLLACVGLLRCPIFPSLCERNPISSLFSRGSPAASPASVPAGAKGCQVLSLSAVFLPAQIDCPAGAVAESAHDAHQSKR